jgi:hypothetical protein
MQNGEILTKTRKMNCEISVHEKTGRLIYKITDSDQFVIFRSKNVVISNGGVQGIHPELFNWFPNLSSEQAMASDYLLGPDGYKETMKKIRKQNLKKVVIIGGSHSGFSCAWMLLNGPSAYYNNNAQIQIDKEP